MAVVLPHYSDLSQLELLQAFPTHLNGPRTISDLAVSTRQTPSEIKRHVDLLVRRGVLSQQGEVVSLTHEGHLLQCLLNPSSAEFDDDRMCAGLGQFGLKARRTTKLLIDLLIGVALMFFVSICVYLTVLRASFGWLESTGWFLLPCLVALLGICKVLQLRRGAQILNRFKGDLDLSALKEAFPTLNLDESTDVAAIDRLIEEALQKMNTPPRSAPEG